MAKSKLEKEFEEFIEDEETKEIGQEDLWDWEENKFMVGVFIEVEEDVGDYDSNMYTLELRSGERVRFWGNSILDKRLSTCTFGEEIAIKFDGIKESDKTGRDYKHFKVFKK